MIASSGEPSKYMYLSSVHHNLSAQVSQSLKVCGIESMYTCNGHNKQTAAANSDGRAGSRMQHA